MSILIEAPFNVSPAVLERLKLDHGQAAVALLQNVITGSHSRVARSRAVYLSQHDDVPTQIHHLQLLLENEAEYSHIRRLAAAILGRINTPEAEKILIRSSQVRDSNILASVVTALGRIGGETALKAVVEAQGYAIEPASSLARFAAALISYRLGLEGNDLPVPRGDEYMERASGATHPVEITHAEEGEARACLQSLAMEPFGVEFSNQNLYQVRCERNSLMLLLNRDFTGQDAIRKLQERKALFGVVARKNPTMDSYSISFLVLTSPSGQAHSNHIWINRSTGEPAFHGTAQLIRDKAEFEISTLAGPGAFSVRFEGTFDGHTFKFRTALSGLFGEKPREPIRKPGHRIPSSST
jgi:hypothetical protein